MADTFSAKKIMDLSVAIGLDAFTAICLGIQALGSPTAIFIGESFSYIPKILSVVLLGNWNLRSKGKMLKNKKILLKLIPWIGDLPLNTFYVLTKAKDASK